MDKLGAVLAVAALVIGGYAVMQLGEKNSQIEELQAANQELRDRMVTLETGVEGALGDEPAAGLRDAEGSRVLARASDGTPIGLKGRPATAMDRLAALEKRVAAQDETIAKYEADKKAEGDALSSANSAMRRFTRDGFYGNLDMAAKSLDMKDNQKTDMQDISDRARRELDDLYNSENDEGTTWKEARKPKMIETNGISLAMPDMKKLAAFKKGRIPGSSETFGEAEKRIRKDAFGRMRNVLTPEQAKKWDKAHKESMLGPGGGGVVSAVSFVGMGSDD